MKRSRWDEDSDDEEDRAKTKAAKKAAKEAKKSKNALGSTSEADKSAVEPPKDQQSVQPLSQPLHASKAAIKLHGRKRLPPYMPSRSVENYERLNYIDEGTYGMVFRGRCLETNEVYALKQVKLNPDEVARIGFPQTAFREINILLALNHPNIVKVREMVIGSTIDKIYMVMEYCENDLRACMHNNRQSFSTGEVSADRLHLFTQ
jgi:cell division cycle 2-like protein